jgi:hypothetical protein
MTDFKTFSVSKSLYFALVRSVLAYLSETRTCSETCTSHPLSSIVATVNSPILYLLCFMGRMGGVAVSALASHHCDPGRSILGRGVICELSLLLILSLASRVFLWVLRFSSLHKNQHSLDLSCAP